MPPSSEKVAEQVSKLIKDDKSLLRIPKPCAEQFSDRTALASCSIVQNVDEQARRRRDGADFQSLLRLQ